jgi:hypothetical protein
LHAVSSGHPRPGASGEVFVSYGRYFDIAELGVMGVVSSMEQQNTARRSRESVPVPDEKECVIVSMGAEGGGVKLLGRRTAEGSWEFRRATNDSSWAMLDEKKDPNATVVLPTWVSTWNEAVALLDRYLWALLYPIAVHPDFRAEVLVEVTRRLLDAPPERRNDRMARWLAVCSDEPRG